MGCKNSSNEISEANIENIKKALGVDADVSIKAKEIRSSLDGLTFDLSVRRNGKTRKVIDNAINILYEDGRVLVHDHDTEDGVKSMMNMNDMLAKLIWKRLVLEDSRFKGISTEFHKHYKNGILTLNHTQ